MADTEFTYTPITAIRSIEDADAFRESVREFARKHWPAWKADMRPRNCPFCGLDDPEPSEPFADAFEVSRCRCCNSLYVNPVPTEAQLESFYGESEPIRVLNEIYARRAGKPAGFVNDSRMEKVLSCLGQAQSGQRQTNSVLEIGCNNGRFVEGIAHAAIARGLELDRLVGIDVDDSVLPSTAEGQPEFRAASLHDLAQSGECNDAFDLVCHFELIEHLPDPSEFMEDAARVLRPSGFMVFSTPNAVGMEMEAAGYNDDRLLSHAIFPPMHLNAFSIQNMTLFAIRCGFRVISLETPGRLDVDCVVRYVENGDAREPVFRSLVEMDRDMLSRVQALVARLRASSTLLVVLQVPERS